MLTQKEKITIDLFCSVVDNYGDVGVCYRLARELAHNNKKITIYIDDLKALQAIEPKVPIGSKSFQISPNIIIKYWENFCENYSPSDVVIEAFACSLGECYLQKFTSQTLWINLEYLSAEEWVEGCHTLPSLQNNGISKYFFFPGFTSKTGGLNFESSFPKISYANARERVKNILGLPKESLEYFIVQIFTYETPQLFLLIESILKHHPNTMFLLPEGRSTKYLLETEASRTNTIKNKYPQAKWHLFPMLQQEEYNYLIKACDLNIVRGEDSITQAVISGRPFLWHIYQQENNAHLDKLEAFTKLMTIDCSAEIQKTIINAFLALNNSATNSCSASVNFDEFMIKYGEIFGLCKKWSERLVQNNSLGRNLSEFINSCLDKE